MIHFVDEGEPTRPGVNLTWIPKRGPRVIIRGRDNGVYFRVRWHPFRVWCDVIGRIDGHTRLGAYPHPPRPEEPHDGYPVIVWDGGSNPVVEGWGRSEPKV
mgnify:CR=1 FL=1